MSKNAPIRILDVPVEGLSIGPSAKPEVFNPYTGSIITTATSERYGLSMYSSGAGTWRTLSIPISADDPRIIYVRVQIPGIFLRISNPRYTIERIKFFFTFTDGAFDSYMDAQFFTGGDVHLNKIVTADSTSVANAQNNANSGVVPVSGHIARLFEKYTLAELCIITGLVSTTDGLSSDDLLRIFTQGLRNLTIYTQVGFQDLVPTTRGKRVPYVQRTSADVPFTFSEERLQSDILTDIDFAVEGSNYMLMFNQENIRTIEYTLYSWPDKNIPGMVSMGSFIHTLPSTDAQQSFRVNLPTRITDFRWINEITNTIEVNMQSRLDGYDSSLHLVIDKVTTRAGTSHTGNDIVTRYGLSTRTLYPRRGGETLRPASFGMPFKLDLRTGFRTFFIDVTDNPDIIGFAIVYGFAPPPGGGFNPGSVRYYSKSLLSKIMVGSTTRYVIQDPFDGSRSAFPSFRERNTAVNLTSVTVYVMLSNGRLGVTVGRIENPPIIRLSKLVPTATSSPGYFVNSIRLSSNRQSVEFIEFGRRDSQLECITNFNLVIERLSNGVWSPITGGTIVCRMRFNNTYTGILVDTPGQIAAKSFSIAPYTQSRGQYRVRAVPVIPAAFSALYENTTSLTQINFTR
jgi:hypothetical protein